MKRDELDHILAGEGEILPSSGFADSVMDAVRREASTPPPIAFPWSRALPGILVTGLIFALLIVGSLTQGGTRVASPTNSAAWWSATALIMNAAMNPVTAWAVLMLLLTLTLIRFSIRVTSRRT